MPQTYATGKSLRLTLKLNPTDTSLKGNADIGVTKGRLYFQNDNQYEWIEFTGVTNNGDGTWTYSNLRRGLSQTAKPVTTGTGQTWLSGSQAILVAMHDQIPDASYALECPSYANAAARDAAITSPSNGMQVYLIAEGTYSDYQNGAWNTRANGAVGNATPTTSGKVEQAIVSEILSSASAGGSGAPLFISPDYLTKVDSFIAGEAFSSGDAMAIETFYLPLTCDSQLTFGNATATQWLAFRMVGNGLAMTSLNIGLKKVGTPADNVSIEIQADVAGAPSGTALSTGTFAGGSLTTSTTNVPITVTSITPTDATPYWVVLKRSGALDGSNYYQVAVHTDDTIAFPYRTNNAGSWGSNTLTESPSIYSTGFYGAIAVRARATVAKFAQVLGFAPSVISQWGTIGKNQTKMYGGLSGLRDRLPYFLSDTAGAISLTPGTVKSYVGTARGSTTIVMPTISGVSLTTQTITASASSLQTIYSATNIYSDTGFRMSIYGSGSTSFQNSSVGVDFSYNEGATWVTLWTTGGANYSLTDVFDFPPGLYRVYASSGNSASSGITVNAKKLLLI